MYGKCENCVYCRQYDGVDCATLVASGKIGANHYLECRRLPPKVHEDNQTRFPKVSIKSDGCGMFEPIEQDQTKD